MQEEQVKGYYDTQKACDEGLNKAVIKGAEDGNRN